MMTPIPHRRFTSPLNPDRIPTRRDLPAVRATTYSSVPLPDTTPTPLLPPPPGPRPARQSIPVDETPVAVPEDLALDLLLRTVPRVVRSKEDLALAPIAHRDWYVLALIDGQTSVQGLVDIAGMPPDDVLRILQRLRRIQLITLS